MNKMENINFSISNKRRQKMNLRPLIITCLITVTPLIMNAKNGIMVSFKTGSLITGTSIGLKMGPFVPIGGLDIFRVAASFDEDYTSWHAEHLGWNEQTQQYEYGDLKKEYDRSSTLKGSAILFIPHAGLKFHFNKFYLLGELSLIIPSVDGRDKGKRIWYDEDGNVDEMDEWDDKLTKKDKEDINDALNFIGLTFGFGVEYPFTEHFSLSGEYGFRIFFNDIEYSDEDIDDEEGSIHWKDEWDDKISMSLGVTYTSFILNYYF